MPKKPKNKINLLIQEGLAATTGGRVVAWILSTFRVIVIATELIVMIAFLSRFWLDAQNTDLDEKLKEKKTVIASFLDFEKEFKQTQNKLKIYSQLSQNQQFISNSVKSLVSNLPPDIFLESLSFSENTIFIQGTSPSEISIQQLIVNLDSKENFAMPYLSEMDTLPNNPSLLQFKIQISLEQKG